MPLGRRSPLLPLLEMSRSRKSRRLCRITVALVSMATLTGVSMAVVFPAWRHSPSDLVSSFIPAREPVPPIPSGVALPPISSPLPTVPAIPAPAIPPAIPAPAPPPPPVLRPQLPSTLPQGPQIPHNNKEHLDLEELRDLVAQTKGYLVRDWSLGLGWNNVRCRKSLC
jgi:hypothetical protein